MKKIAFLLLALCSVGATFTADALEVNKKFNKPTDEELNMTTYAPDSDAVAVKLYSCTDVTFGFRQDFVVLYFVKERIKVLKPEGTSAADVKIIYYDPQNANDGDRISGIKGSSYNVENGKVVRSKLTGDLKSKERIDKYHSMVKFSIPNVKAGSVIEYEFERQSPYITSISDWYAQCDIPVFFTEYNMEVPEWFNFNTAQQGAFSLVGKREPGNFSTSVGGGLLTCPSTVYHFEGSQLPAAKDDDYVWCVEDYMAKVEHDLRSIEITGAYYKNFQTHWANVDEMLVKDEDFGNYLDMKNPLAAEQADLSLDGLDVKAKTEKLRDLLMSYYRWDDTYGLYAISPKKLQKEVAANNATLNFALMSMLRDAGIQAHPVVLSRRDKGRLPYAHPSVQSLNTTVLAVEENDSTLFFVDAAAKGYPVGSLRPNELVDRGRMIFADREGQWLDLTHISQGAFNSMTTVTVGADGLARGERQGGYHDIYAGHVREIYHDQTDSVAFVQHIASSNNVEIESYEVNNIDDNSTTVTEKISFTRQLETDGEHIYLNPFFFIDEESPFTAETRILPVEFGFPVSERYSYRITLPEGYVVEESPKSIALQMPNSDMIARVKITMKGNDIIISYMFKRTAMIYNFDQYQYLRDFRAKLEAKFKEMVVLKKVAQ